MLAVNNPHANVGRPKRLGFIPWVGKIPRRRAWQSTPVFLPGESQGQRSLAGYSPWGYKESDTTEVAKHACVCVHAHTHTHTHTHILFLWRTLIHLYVLPLIQFFLLSFILLYCINIITLVMFYNS